MTTGTERQPRFVPPDKADEPSDTSMRTTTPRRRVSETEPTGKGFRKRIPIAFIAAIIVALIWLFVPGARTLGGLFGSDTPKVSAPPAVTADTVHKLGHWAEGMDRWMRTETVPALNESLKVQATQAAKIEALEAQVSDLRAYQGRHGWSTGLMPSINDVRVAGMTILGLLLVAGIGLGGWYVLKRLTNRTVKMPDDDTPPSDVTLSVPEPVSHPPA